jgi:hypothetical protein
LMFNYTTVTALTAITEESIGIVNCRIGIINR